MTVKYKYKLLIGSHVGNDYTRPVLELERDQHGRQVLDENGRPKSRQVMDPITGESKWHDRWYYAKTLPNGEQNPLWFPGSDIVESETSLDYHLANKGRKYKNPKFERIFADASEESVATIDQRIAELLAKKAELEGSQVQVTPTINAAPPNQVPNALPESNPVAQAAKQGYQGIPVAPQQAKPIPNVLPAPKEGFVGNNLRAQLEVMNVQELTDHAAENEIDLKGARGKNEMIRKILEAEKQPA